MMLPQEGQLLVNLNFALAQHGKGNEIKVGCVDKRPLKRVHDAPHILYVAGGTGSRPRTVPQSVLLPKPPILPRWSER